MNLQAPHGEYCQWTLPSTDGIESLKFDEHVKFRALEDDELLIRMHAAPLNYRELLASKGGFPGAEVRLNVIPGSDGAGVVEAIGSAVKDFGPGDQVFTFMQSDRADDTPAGFSDIQASMGSKKDGTLRQYAYFRSSALVRAPQNISFAQAATLTCSGLTAYNALNGIQGRAIGPGDQVLVQGSGGVSVAALQFAVAVGAEVVATSSNEVKAKKLRQLGAKEVIDYRTVPACGEAARKLTRDGRGFDIIVDVGGDLTLGETLKAVRPDGIVTICGMLGGAEYEAVPMLASPYNACIVRGILLGTKNQCREMVRLIEAREIQPALDDVIFGLRDVKEAYRRMERQEHFSKVVIEID